MASKIMKGNKRVSIKSIIKMTGIKRLRIYKRSNKKILFIQDYNVATQDLQLHQSTKNLDKQLCKLSIATSSSCRLKFLPIQWLTSMNTYLTVKANRSLQGQNQTKISLEDTIK